MNIDKDTTKLNQEGEETVNFISSEGWRLAKRKLLERVSNLDTIRGLKGKTAEEKIIDIKVRGMVIDMILEWIDEIEGASEMQKEQTRKVLAEIRDEDYIQRDE